MADGHDVCVLTRSRTAAVGQVWWNPVDLSRDWTATVSLADAVINLAGCSIAGGRWTESRKKSILNSRLQATHGLVAAILSSRQPPRVLVSASAVGYYGPCGDNDVTEASPAGHDFLARVCQSWEAAALAASGVTRVVLLRTGLVLDRGAGALPRLALPFRFFVGGPAGSGQQYVPWIHRADFTALVRWAIESRDVSGPLNATAPKPTTNREFAMELGRVLRRPSLLRAPGFALRMLLGEMADALILGGQRAPPARAEAAGFRFQYPRLGPALEALYR